MLDSKAETFLQVAQHKSYTAAADALHLTQPAVTQHIHKLETHYGCRLIDSSGRTVRLTEQGNMLYEYLAAQRANERRFLGRLHGAMPPLCIGATLSIADYYLPEPLAGCLLSGGARIRVVVGNTGSLLGGLRSGALDCAFIEGLFDSALFESREFYGARFLAIASASHPLAGKPVPLSALHAFPLALREPGSGTRELLESALYQRNDRPQSFSQVLELGSFVLIKELVRRSHAVTFAYEAVARQEMARGELCALDIEGFHVTHPLYFVFRRGDGRAKQFDALLQSILGGA